MNWHGPLAPTDSLHEACRYFTNWTITARRGVHHALRRRGLPDVEKVTLADLARLTRAELLTAYGIGSGTVRFLAGILDRAGLALAPDAAIEDATDETLIDLLPSRGRASARLPVQRANPLPVGRSCAPGTRGPCPFGAADLPQRPGLFDRA